VETLSRPRNIDGPFQLLPPNGRRLREMETACSACTSGGSSAADVNRIFRGAHTPREPRACSDSNISWLRSMKWSLLDRVPGEGVLDIAARQRAPRMQDQC